MEGYLWLNSTVSFKELIQSSAVS